MKIFDFEMSPGGIIVDMNTKNIESISESAIDSRASLMASLRDVITKLQHAMDYITFSAEDNSAVMVECFDIQRTLNKLLSLTIGALGAYYSLEKRFYNEATSAMMPWRSKLEQISEILKSKGVDIKSCPVKAYYINRAVFSKGNLDGYTFKDQFFEDAFGIMPAADISSSRFESMYEEETTHTNLICRERDHYEDEYSDRAYKKCIDKFSEATKRIFMKLYDAQTIAHSVTDMSSAKMLLTECARASMNMQAAMIECVMDYGLKAYNAMRLYDTMSVLALHADTIVAEVNKSGEVNN